MKEAMEGFPAVLKELRVAHAYTQQQLAQRLQISASAVSMYELGKREPGLRLLIRMAGLFRVTMDYLSGVSVYGAAGREISDALADFCTQLEREEFCWQNRVIPEQERKNLAAAIRFSACEALRSSSVI